MRRYRHLPSEVKILLFISLHESPTYLCTSARQHWRFFLTALRVNFSESVRQTEIIWYYSTGFVQDILHTRYLLCFCWISWKCCCGVPLFFLLVPFYINSTSIFLIYAPWKTPVVVVAKVNTLREITTMANPSGKKKQTGIFLQSPTDIADELKNTKCDFYSHIFLTWSEINTQNWCEPFSQ